MDHREFLDLFSSSADAAMSFSVRPNDIAHWRMRGIPAARWPQAERIAAARGWKVTALMLADQRPSRRTADLSAPAGYAAS